MPRLAVCSWSLQPTGPADLVEKIRACGINAVQLALDPIRRGEWDEAETARALADAGDKLADLAGQLLEAGTPSDLAETDAETPPPEVKLVRKLTRSQWAKDHLPRYRLRRRNLTANGEPVEDRFVVRARSQARLIPTKSLNERYVQLRHQLEADGVLKRHPRRLCLQCRRRLHPQ